MLIQKSQAAPYILHLLAAHCRSHILADSCVLTESPRVPTFWPPWPVVIVAMHIFEMHYACVFHMVTVTESASMQFEQALKQKIDSLSSHMVALAEQLDTVQRQQPASSHEDSSIESVLKQRLRKIELTVAGMLCMHTSLVQSQIPFLATRPIYDLARVQSLPEL